MVLGGKELEGCIYRRDTGQRRSEVVLKLYMYIDDDQSRVAPGRVSTELKAPRLMLCYVLYTVTTLSGKRRSPDHGRIIPKRWVCVIDVKKKKKKKVVTYVTGSPADTG